MLSNNTNSNRSNPEPEAELPTPTWSFGGICVLGEFDSTYGRYGTAKEAEQVAAAALRSWSGPDLGWRISHEHDDGDYLPILISDRGFTAGVMIDSDTNVPGWLSIERTEPSAPIHGDDYSVQTDLRGIIVYPDEMASKALLEVLGL